ncbi:MAG: DUF1501 domain-containing protein [Bacteroidia bacterium]|nr:DUF1501 domain-containing protein [Bacteroidia bacterium]NNF30223.1 DUF1501 domain-containing protein [Flavobacteriaceae bacterium]MBT8274516.1 DUF1501 domain-containing protein [Bacteroidia bacterium]NNJ83084.1 DUF1501 domain-containing protein [Flavobacteriaceae bacterium]NNK54692.1 DUF1501 domain-containing protein [Flavobacteriaceae bacterium]
MKRRDFLKNSALASSLFFVPGFIKAMDAQLSLPAGYKRLVIIQLAGGNDGLNTIIPFRNDIYYRERPSIAIKQKHVIALNDELGFHKNLAPLKSLYDAGELTVINNVGYPNPNRSHFRSTDIWHTASASNELLKDGWIGRYLDLFGDKPYNAIEIGNSLSLIMQGKLKNGVVAKDAVMLNKIAGDPFFKQLLTYNQDQHLSEHNMGYLYQTMIDAKQSADYIYEKTRVSKSTFDYGNSRFGKQMKTLAEFINSQLDTRVYYAALGGFDTHANQAGQQDELLKTYADGVSTLVADLKSNGTFDDTLILTFSEFGRRVAQNAANGTDHGAANNVFVIGKNLKTPGFYNQAPDLRNLDANGDLVFEIDFRRIYANLMEKWLDIPSSSLLSETMEPLHII